MTIIGTSILQRDPGATVIVAPYGPRGPVIAGTSLSAVTVANGPVTFEMTEYGLGFAPGIRVRATALDGTGNPTTNWLEGVVTDYEAATLEVMADLHSGSDVYYSWQLTVAGQPGVQGAPGPKGDTGQVPEAPQNHLKYARIDGQWASINADLDSKAPLDSPVLTGNPQLATSPATADNDKSIATTEYVKANIAALTFQPLDADLTALAAAAATGTTGIYYRKAADTWVPLAMGSGITLDTTANTLNVTAGGGNVSNSGTPVVNDLAQWASSNTIKSLPISGLYNGATFTGTTTFSGPAVAQTPATADNSTAVATTAYVRAVVRSTYGVRGLTGSAGITAGYNININISEAVLRNASGVPVFFGAYGGVIDSRAVGIPLGCDVALNDGDVSAYLIWGATPGASMICSNANPSAGPALPSGFTHWGYLTTVKRSGGSFYAAAMRGNKVYYNSAPAIAANVNNSAWTPYSVAAFVPAVALNMMVSCYAVMQTGGGGGAGLIYYIGWSSSGAQYVTRLDLSFGGMTGTIPIYATLPNVSQQVYHLWQEIYGAANVSTNGFYINLIGFEVPNDA